MVTADRGKLILDESSRKHIGYNLGTTVQKPHKQTTKSYQNDTI